MNPASGEQGRGGTIWYIYQAHPTRLESEVTKDCQGLMWTATTYGLFVGDWQGINRISYKQFLLYLCLKVV